MTSPGLLFFSSFPSYLVFDNSPSWFLCMLQLATSLLHCSAHHLPSLSHSNSSTPSPHWDGHHDSSRLALSARMHRRCRGKAEQPYRFSLTDEQGESHAVRMLISFHFNLQPAGKHLSKTQLYIIVRQQHVHKPHGKIPEESANGCQLTNTNSCSVDMHKHVSGVKCKHILPLVKKCCQLKQIGGCRADTCLRVCVWHGKHWENKDLSKWVGVKMNTIKTVLFNVIFNHVITLS